MHIMTENGWKQLTPTSCIPPKHVPTLCEALGIDSKRNYVKDMIDYANSKGYYYTYHMNGTATLREH